jgi:hypothetical protein
MEFLLHCRTGRVVGPGRGRRRFVYKANVYVSLQAKVLDPRGRRGAVAGAGRGGK